MHAVAIRLRDDGLCDHVIAVALEIDDEQVAPLLQIADSKLTNLMAVAFKTSSRTGGIDRPHPSQAIKLREQGESS
jgi:hypothetical protein